MAKPKSPPAPKEQYINFDRRDPTQDEQKLLIEIATKLGVRPGYIGAIANHESLGSWNPEIRPSHPERPPVKVTLDGQLRGGKPSTTAVGIGQWLDTRWLMDMYTNGEKLIEVANLKDNNPAAIETIRSVNKLVKSHLDSRGQKPIWEVMDAIEGKIQDRPEVKALMKLRSDKTNRIPIAMLGLNIIDYKNELQQFNIPVNATTIYGSHHTSAANVARLSRDKNYKPAEDGKWGAAAAYNGGIFVNKDGSAKTGAESLAFYAMIVSDAHASLFERKFYGRDFGAAADDDRLRAVTGTDGKSYKIRQELVTPRLPTQQFYAAWKTPAPSVEKPENLAGAVGALRRLGYYAGKADPESFDNSRLRLAVAAFKHQAGLPFADKGVFDDNTRRYLNESIKNADFYIGQQQEQQENLQNKRGINLRTITKELKALPKDSPYHQQVAHVVIDLKQNLAKEGLLKPPVKYDKVVDAKGKTRKVPVEQPFDASIDGKLISAYSRFQQQNGLMDTKGLYETVSRRMLLKGGAEPAKIPAAPTAPAASQPGTTTPRRQSGVVTGAVSPYPTEQFAGMSPPSAMAGVKLFDMKLDDYASGQVSTLALTEALKTPDIKVTGMAMARGTTPRQQLG